MPNITTCLECAQPVMVPDGLAESAALRCPLCDAEYPAQEVIELMIETGDATDGHLPPELTPVESSEANNGHLPPELTPVESSPETESDSTEEEAGTLVKCPCCDAQFGLSEVILVATGEELGEAAAAIGPDGSIASAHEKPSDLPNFGPSSENHAPFGIAIDTGEEAAPSTSDRFDFQDQKADHRDSALANMAAAGGVRRRRGSQKHALRFIAEVVFGGVTGLTITYYGLNFFGGERFDWFDLYLPGVAHTEEYRPEWWPGKSGKSDPEETDTDSTGMLIETPAGANLPGGDGLGGFASPGEVKPEEPPMEAPIPVHEPSEDPADEPQKEPPPSPPVGPIDPPSFTSDELGQVLKNTHNAFTSDGLADETYRLLCQLAETVTFVELADGGPKLRNRLEAVEILLRKMGHDELNLIKIGEMAAGLAFDQARAENGILLAGTVESNLKLGQTHGASVQLSAADGPLLVLSKTRMPAKVGDRVLVLGSIVDNPAQNMVGTDTSTRRVIWSRMTVKLDN